MSKKLQKLTVTILQENIGEFNEKRGELYKKLIEVKRSNDFCNDFRNHRTCGKFQQNIKGQSFFFSRTHHYSRSLCRTLYRRHEQGRKLYRLCIDTLDLNINGTCSRKVNTPLKYNHYKK